MRFLRLALAVLVALLPSPLKVAVYRTCYGYRIGKGVRIGLSLFVGVRSCTIGDHARIGSWNAFTNVRQLDIGGHARIGFLNLFRGGERISIGAYATVLRLNVCNAIVDGDFVEPVTSTLHLGAGSFLASGHWLDFSAGIHVGDHSILGGRNSSLWTHNRQQGRPIVIGSHAYLGSDVRLAPGARVPGLSIVALGSVIIGEVTEPRVLIGGNPARVIRTLGGEDLLLVTRKTRNDMPDELNRADLPQDLLPLIDPGVSASGPSVPP